MEDTMNAQPRWISGIEPPGELRTQSMTSIYERECREQPERLAELIRAYSEEKSIRAELDKLRHVASATGPVLFVGMGASYCSSITGSIWLQSCGRSSFFVDAGEWLHYARAVRDRVAVSILLTTSGESAELVQLCKEDTQNPFALLCNNEKSTCWSAAQIRLPILAGPEYANATKTYTNSTAACIAMASHLAGRGWQADAAQVLDVYSDNLDRVFDQRSELEEFCRAAANIEVIGRGAAYGGAIMSSLCIREMTGQRAAAHSGAGFRHGPLLDVNESHVAIILAVGREAELGLKLAHDCNARGGKVILVGTEEREASEKLMPVKISSVPEPWEGLTSLIAAQALTLGMVEKYGAKLPPRFQYGVMEE
ncbi:MAG: SIS domain-containing protein [Candidatus Sulfotelmatobacter sp.]